MLARMNTKLFRSDSVETVVLNALLQCLTVSTKLLIIDSITSNSAVYIPVGPIIQACKSRYAFYMCTHLFFTRQSQLQNCLGTLLLACGQGIASICQLVAS